MAVYCCVSPTGTFCVVGVTVIESRVAALLAFIPTTPTVPTTTTIAMARATYRALRPRHTLITPAPAATPAPMTRHPANPVPVLFVR